MFKHVLIATDGSPLSDSASRSAVKLAKSLSAQVTAITVSTPFHAFTSNYVMLTDTEDGYNDDCERRARSSLDVVGRPQSLPASPSMGCMSSTNTPMRRLSKQRTRRVAMSSAWPRMGAKERLR